MTTFTIILALLAPQPTTSTKPTPASPAVKVVKAHVVRLRLPADPPVSRPAVLRALRRLSRRSDQAASAKSPPRRSAGRGHHSVGTFPTLLRP